MNQRTRILATVFVLGLLVVVLGRSVGPSITGLFSTEQKIQALEEEKAELEEFDRRFQNARLEYKEYVSRTGATSYRTVGKDIYERLNELIHDYRFPSWSLGKVRAAQDRKNGWFTLAVPVAVTGNLKSTMEFMREVYEFPHVLQVLSPKITPEVSRQSKKPEDQVRLAVTLVALVPPTSKLLGEIDLKDLEQPEEVIRHHDPDIKQLAMRQPFMEWVEPPPPPPERPPPIVKKPEPKPEVKPPPPPEPVDLRWKGNWQLVGTYRRYSPQETPVALVSSSGGRSSGETKTVQGGEEFDGGTLVEVQPRGALVKREDGQFIYRLGEEFNAAVPLAQAEGFESLKDVARRLDEERAPVRAPDSGDGSELLPEMPPVPGDEDPRTSKRPLRDKSAPPPTQNPEATGAAPLDLSQFRDVAELEALKLEQEEAAREKTGTGRDGSPQGGKPDRDGKDPGGKDAGKSDKSAGEGKSDKPDKRKSDKDGKSDKSKGGKDPKAGGKDGEKPSGKSGA